MLEMINKIMLNTKMSVVVEINNNKLGKEYALGMQKTLMPYGFVASPALLEALLTLNEDEFKNTLELIENIIKEMVGAHVEHKPMYVNFPWSVIEKTNEELLADRLIGYYVDYYGKSLELLGDKTFDYRTIIKFDGDKKERIKLDDDVEYKVINLATIKDFEDLIKSFMSSKTDLTIRNKEYLEWALDNYSNIENIIPNSIPFKETLVIVASHAIKNKFDINKMPLKTGTDVLRLAVAMSDGDISLSTNTRFRKFSRPEKRFILSLLNSVNYSTLVEDVLRRKEQFKKLVYGLDLTSNENKNKYLQLKSVINAIYNHEHLDTYRNKLAFALTNKDTETSVKLLSQRPGEFARSLDKVLRDAKNKDYVLKEFEKVAHKVATPTLWKLKGYFETRNDEEKIIVMPKGLSSKIVEYQNTKTILDDKICKKVCEVIEKAISLSYQEKEEMGNVYIDKSLKQFLIPTSNRTANTGLNVYTRGSALKLKKDTKGCRLFIYWKGRDVDLSCTFLGENLEYIEHISFTNLKFKGATHSGDITFAPNGASEFIDIDLEEIRKYSPKIRYAVMQVFSYSCENFNKIEDCFVGIMEREDLNKGEIFEPSTAKIKSNLLTPNVSVCPLIIDLDTSEVYWADIAVDNNLKYRCYATQAVETTFDKTQLAVKMILNMKNKLPNVYDILKENVKARGGKLVSRVDDSFINEDGEILEKEEVEIFDKPDFGDLVANYL